MQTFQGKISMSRVTSNREPEFITIELNDETSGVRVVTVKLSKEELANIITGFGARPCEFEFSDVAAALIGKNREVTSFPITLPKGWMPNISRDKLSVNIDEVPQSVMLQFAVHEHHNWLPNLRDLTNHHKMQVDRDGTRVQDVGFHRYV